MDDITIVGDASAGYEFFVLLEHELKGIGLSVNREKTVMTSNLFVSDVKCKFRATAVGAPRCSRTSLA